MTEALSVDRFRQAMGRFPTGVTVVSAPGTASQPHVMTANAVTSVSLDPCLVLVCIEREARFHDAVVAGGPFGLSILAAGQRRVSDWLATRGRPLVDQLGQIRHRPGPLTGVPLVEGALATLECTITAVHPGGDHSIVVGEVLGVELAADASDPLVWFRGAYGALG